MWVWVSVVGVLWKSCWPDVDGVNEDCVVGVDVDEHAEGADCLAGFDDQSAARPGSGFESFGEARCGKLVYGGGEVGGREPFGLSGFG